MEKYKVLKVKGKRIDEHRLIFAKHIGRELTNKEVVHHIDGDKANNKIENLKLFPTKNAHTKFHHLNGDLKLNAGKNKKVLYLGKLKCCRCKLYKDPSEFVTSKRNHLGISGICKECNKIDRARRE